MPRLMGDLTSDLVELIFGTSEPNASPTAFNSVISPTGVDVP